MHAYAPARSSATTSRFAGFRWRVVDIVVAAILGVAIGLVFWAWNTIGYAWFTAMDAVTPGLGGIASGIWMLGGVVGGLVIRKPGAALLVEVIAAIVSMLISSGFIWGWTIVLSGLAQGLGAELVFAIFLYARFTLPVAMLAGAASGAFEWFLELFTGPNLPKSLEFNLIYLCTNVVSGAVLAGLVGWLLVRALAATGALNRFAAGREARREV